MSDVPTQPSDSLREGSEIERFGQREECPPAAQCIRDRIEGMTPPNEQLLELADRNPPPGEWFSANEESPF
jgi:hypothetical protein